MTLSFLRGSMLYMFFMTGLFVFLVRILMYINAGLNTLSSGVLFFHHAKLLIEYVLDTAKKEFHMISILDAG